MRNQDCLSPNALRSVADRLRQRVIAVGVFEINEETHQDRPIAKCLEPYRERKKREIAAQESWNENDRLSVSKAGGTSDHDRLPRDRQDLETCIRKGQRPRHEEFERRYQSVRCRRSQTLFDIGLRPKGPVIAIGGEEFDDELDACWRGLPEHPMTATGNDDQLRVRNKFRHQCRILRRDQFIEIPGQHHRGAADAGERLRPIEFRESLELQIGGMQGRWQCNFTPHLVFGKHSMPFEITGRVGYLPDASRSLLRRETVEVAHHLDDGGLGIGCLRAARRRRAEDQAQNAVRKLPYKFLRNGAAHRIAEHVDLGYSELVEKSTEIASQVRDRVTYDRLVAQSRAAIVQRDHGEPLSQLFDEGRRPRSRIEPIAHHQNKRRPLALHAVSDPDTVHFGKTHRHLATLAPYSPETRCPPSTTTTLPVMNDPAFEISNNSGPSSSLSCPRRRCGTRLTSALPCSLSKKSSLSSVAKYPGASALTRMP